MVDFLGEAFGVYGENVLDNVQTIALALTPPSQRRTWYVILLCTARRCYSY